MPNSQLLDTLDNTLALKNKAAKIEEEETLDIIPQVPSKGVPDEYAPRAKAIYSIDLNTNTILTSKSADEQLPVASLTKLMTAYVILKEEKDLDRVIIVTGVATQPGDSIMGISNGDGLSIRALLEGLLVNSGSDAAQALAMANSGSQTVFVDKMNQYATNLKLEGTNFTNPVGWDDSGNYSNAKDITELTRILLRNEEFKRIIQIKSTTVTTQGGKRVILETTNKLLHETGYIGVKTGYTPIAGECLISLYKEGEKEILTTIIGSPARFAETKSIKGWILDHFSW